MKLKFKTNPTDWNLTALRIRMTDCPAVWMVVALVAVMPHAQGAEGAWNTSAAGTWSTAGNWNPAVVPGTAAGDTVDLTFDLSVARTVTIDTTSRTVGDLNIGDSGASYFAYTLAASGGAVLNLDGAGSGPATVDFRGPLTGGVTEIVSGGNLRLNGSLSGAVDVANGGTLSGTGVASGLATIANGGTISPGTSPGRLTLAGGLSLTGTYLAEIASALSSDSLNITGDFAAVGTIKIRLLDGFSPAESERYDLADWTGTFTGAPVFDFSEAALSPGLHWDTASFATDGAPRVIPEPSVALLAMLTGVGLACRRRARPSV